MCGQGVGQCFDGSIYAITSNAGNIALLFGVSWMVKLVQDDLALAGSFADFLHSSNVAFNALEESAQNQHSDVPNDGAEGGVQMTELYSKEKG